MSNTKTTIFSTILLASLLVAVVGGHVVWLNSHYAEAYASPDAPGYFVQAKLLAQEGRTWIKPESPVQYVGFHFMETDDGRYFSRYPPGLAWISAPVYLLGGPGAAMYVNPIPEKSEDR